MKKKYQVFVSSTFLDLKTERQAAVEAILLAGHIPAGMELFSAGDESQLEVIKKWIEASDIYMVILGGRYGTIEPRSGLSYIEVEYDHAVSLKKPLFALVLHPTALEKKAGEGFVETAEPDKLTAFREKVLSKISRSIEDHKDVKLYTVEAIKYIEDGRPDLAGWVRADEAVDTGPVLAQITSLTKTNSEFRARIDELEARTPPDLKVSDLAGLDQEITIRCRYKVELRYGFKERTLKLQLGLIFGLIGPKLLEHPADDVLRHYLREELFAQARIEDVYSRSINEQDFQTLKIQLSVLKLVEISYSKTTTGSMALFWTLTEFGQQELVRLRAIRRPSGK